MCNRLCITFSRTSTKSDSKSPQNCVFYANNMGEEFTGRPVEAF